MLVVNHQTNNVETTEIISEQIWLSKGVDYKIIYDYFISSARDNPSGNKNLRGMGFLDADGAERYRYGFIYDLDDNLISQERTHPLTVNRPF